MVIYLYFMFIKMKENTAKHVYKFDIQGFHNRPVFQFNALNVSLFVAHDHVSDENLMFKHQDSKSETEMHAEKQKSSRDESLISKFNNYR